MLQLDRFRRGGAQDVLASVLHLEPARTFRLLDVTMSLKLSAQSHIYV